MSELPSDKLRRATRRALLIGLFGLAAAALGGLFRPPAFFFGYLSGFVFWSGVPLGAAAILMMHHLVAGRWGWSIRRPVEAAVMTLPLLLPLFAPVALGAPQLYQWISAPTTDASASPFRHLYLNLPFFLERAAGFLVVWALGGWLLARWSRAQNVPGTSASSGLAALSSGGLVVYFLTATFAGIDWIGSLASDWYSSVFGLYLIVGQGLTALAAIIVLSAVLRLWFELEDAISADVLNDLGNLLLTFVVLHAYMAYAQVFIIWNGNLPRANAWYEPRMHGLWGGVSVFLILVHFGLPFFALLFRALKRDPRRLLTLAAIILFARAIEAAWMVLPAARDVTALAIVLGGFATIGIGGLWLAGFAWQYGRWRVRGARPARAVQET